MGNGTELVKFQGDAIEAVRDGADVWVPVRRVCEALGIAPNGQIQKLKGKEWAVNKFVLSTGPDGKDYNAFALHLDSLPMWLATIETSRVHEEIRGKLARYQIECARVLRDHFFGAPHAVAPPAAIESPRQLSAIAGTLREDAPLLADVRRYVRACARNTGTTERRVRGWIVRVSGAASYLRMPAAYGAFVREQLKRIALGEDAPPWTNPRRALPAHNPNQVEIPWPPVTRPNN